MSTSQAVSAGAEPVQPPTAAEEDAMQFLSDMGILPGTSASIAQVIVDRHVTGRIDSAEQCWASLRFLKDNLHQ